MATEEARGTAAWYENPGDAYLLGIGALDVLIEGSKDAPVRTDGERRWFVSDHRALLASMSFEDRIRSNGLPSELPADARAELNGYLDSWHTALPFNEAERGIVCSAYRSVSRKVCAYREVPGQLRRQEFEIVNVGLRRIVRGRDLMRRWWSWRREMDEFAGQGSLAEAKAALIRITGRMVSPDKMPYIYYDIQGATDALVPPRHAKPEA